MRIRALTGIVLLAGVAAAGVCVGSAGTGGAAGAERRAAAGPPAASPAERREAPGRPAKAGPAARPAPIRAARATRPRCHCRLSPRAFNVTSYGAAGDGKTDNTSVIQAALDAAASAGGGTVTVPSGTFLSGPIEIGSSTNLVLASGAVLKMLLCAAGVADPGCGLAGFTSVWLRLNYTHVI